MASSAARKPKKAERLAIRRSRRRPSRRMSANGSYWRSISGLTAPIAAVSDGRSVPSGRSERTRIENHGRGSRSWAWERKTIGVKSSRRL